MALHDARAQLDAVLERAQALYERLDEDEAERFVELVRQAIREALAASDARRVIHAVRYRHVFTTAGRR